MLRKIFLIIAAKQGLLVAVAYVNFLREQLLFLSNTINENTWHEFKIQAERGEANKVILTCRVFTNSDGRFYLFENSLPTPVTTDDIQMTHSFDVTAEVKKFFDVEV